MSVCYVASCQLCADSWPCWECSEEAERFCVQGQCNDSKVHRTSTSMSTSRTDCSRMAASNGVIGLCASLSRSPLCTVGLLCMDRTSWWCAGDPAIEVPASDDLVRWYWFSRARWVVYGLLMSAPHCTDTHTHTDTIRMQTRTGAQQEPGDILALPKSHARRCKHDWHS